MKTRKTLIRIVACLLIVMTILPAQAFAAGYSTTSTTGDRLVYPSARDYFDESFEARVKASRVNGNIYIMPMPENGHGNLGGVKDGEIVTILAERNGYYFFETSKGYMGWNGKKFFTTGSTSSRGTSTGACLEDSYPTISTTGDELIFPACSDYYDCCFYAFVKASRRGGCIYLMPMAEKGHGNLGTVGDGEEVLILAERDGFYFFMTEDGRYGWNGTRYFY